MSKYTKEYFIKLVESIDKDSFIRGKFEFEGKCCILGHCGIRLWQHNEVSAALTNLFVGNEIVKSGDKILVENPVMLYNDIAIGNNKHVKKLWLQKLKSL